MGINVKEFGEISNGTKTKLIELTNKNGLKASFSDYGAIWVNMLVPDRLGKFEDVVLGFDNASDYEQYNKPHLGSPIGRYANRIGNAKFTLDGITYELEKNVGAHSLHSGTKHWDKRMWDYILKEGEDFSSVSFHIHLDDMDQGFPGNAHVRITYTLTDTDTLYIKYKFTADKKTVCNLTNHAYFNLAGHDSHNILDQEVCINGDSFTFLNEESIATGEIINVENTVMDFRIPKAIGKDIDSNYISLVYGKGYDQNWVLNKNIQDPNFDNLYFAASAYDKKSGRYMKVYTDLDGVQFYTSNSLNIAAPAKDGAIYKNRDAYCFETGHLPNAVNIEHFKTPIVEADTSVFTKTAYHFGTL